jgi:hypothetical protein
MSSTPQDSVNAYQVGGAHYAKGGEYQHWDWVESNGIGYVEGCASKYVTRWRRKNGVQDLEKARHFIAKCRALAAPRQLNVLGFKMNRQGRRNRAHNMGISIIDYANANGLNQTERHICNLLQHWRLDSDLERADKLVQKLIETAPEPLKAAA